MKAVFEYVIKKIIDTPIIKEPYPHLLISGIFPDEFYSILLQEIPKNELPEDIKPEVGMGLVSRTPEGREIQLVVADVKDESIVVDANHPLAGKDLIFEIEVLEIK